MRRRSASRLWTAPAARRRVRLLQLATPGPATRSFVAAVTSPPRTRREPWLPLPTPLCRERPAPDHLPPADCHRGARSQSGTIRGRSIMNFGPSHVTDIDELQRET